jgi:peptidoglycan/xylan/chitin deacetylase (PgdA/CDA1 family)
MNKIYLTLALLLTMSLSSGAGNAKIFYSDGPKDKKVLALTFDDGPAPNTKKVLEILASHNIKSTFFMEGAKLEQYPDIAKEVQNAGHEIGIHLYSHPSFYAYKKSDYREVLINEIEKTQAAAKKALAVKPKLLRMPFGYSKAWVRDVAKEQDLTLINWSFGTDWNKMSKEKMLAAYTKAIKPGAILLLHDSGKKDKPMLNMLDDLIKEIERQGYQAVTISELLDLKR